MRKETSLHEWFRQIEWCCHEAHKSDSLNPTVIEKFRGSFPGSGLVDRL